MVNGTRLPQIRSRKCRNRSRCRRCSCDRQRVPRRRARVGALCGFRGTAEHVPARSPKTGRCADVRGCCGNGKRRRKTPVGGFRRREKPQAARRREKPQAASRTKPRCRARPAAVTTARGAGSLGILRRGCCEGKNSPVGVRSAKSPAVSGKTAGLRTKIGGILVWQATRSSFHSG